MPQRHRAQEGTFHVTTNAAERVSWCTCTGIPEILIRNLLLTRDLSGSQLYAFCVLPDHMHIIVSPGEKGLSKFMQSFKSNSSKDIRDFCEKNQSDCSLSGWQDGFHDERIRDDRQRSQVLSYVQRNAVHHGLVKEPEEWPWTSLHFETQLDPLEVWLD